MKKHDKIFFDLFYFYIIDDGDDKDRLTLVSFIISS